MTMARKATSRPARSRSGRNKTTTVEKMPPAETQTQTIEQPKGILGALLGTPKAACGGHHESEAHRFARDAAQTENMRAQASADKLSNILNHFEAGHKLGLDSGAWTAYVLETVAGFDRDFVRHIYPDAKFFVPVTAQVSVASVQPTPAPVSSSIAQPETAHA
jgi:hypothetical protein